MIAADAADDDVVGIVLEFMALDGSRCAAILSADNQLTVETLPDEEPALKQPATSQGSIH